MDVNVDAAINDEMKKNIYSDEERRRKIVSLSRLLIYSRQ
jgi:hypothetical protein